WRGLREGVDVFSIMRRPLRQSRPQDMQGEGAASAFLGAEIAELRVPEIVPEKISRTASFSSLAALAVLDEAWKEARLDEAAGARVGLVVGGSNFQQRELLLTQEHYRGRVNFLRPSYALSFMDTDLS